MVRAGMFEDYKAEMEKAITEGKVRKLTEAEISTWHGAVHYISTFTVIKPDSLSTRTHIVSNSAMINYNSKMSLNDCMWGGPKCTGRSAELFTVLEGSGCGRHDGPQESLSGYIHITRITPLETVLLSW